MTNPFYYGGVVNKDNFCNRYEEIANLKQDFLSGMNILIYAPRRFGKTSLVLKALEELEKIKFIYLDLMLITDKKEFINNYFNEISKKIETSTDKVIKLLKDIFKIRPNIKVSFDESGIPCYSLEFSKDEIENTLEEVLNLPYRYVNQKKNNIVVVFDEFQEIVNLGIEEKLRSIIQHHGHKLTYVFMGSKKSIMKQLFLDKSRPFYKSVKHFPLKGIPLNEWKNFIKEKFEKTGKMIDDNHIEKIFKITKGFPYYTQQIAYELWNLCENKVSDRLLENTVKIILERENDMFFVEWDSLTQNQKKALKLVVYAKGTKIYSKENMLKFNFDASSLKRAVEGLLQKDVIDHSNRKFYLQDPLFEYWLKIK